MALLLGHTEVYIQEFVTNLYSANNIMVLSRQTKEPTGFVVLYYNNAFRPFRKMSVDVKLPGSVLEALRQFTILYSLNKEVIFILSVRLLMVIMICLMLKDRLRFLPYKLPTIYLGSIFIISWNRNYSTVPNSRSSNRCIKVNDIEIIVGWCL